MKKYKSVSSMSNEDFEKEKIVYVQSIYLEKFKLFLFLVVCLFGLVLVIGIGKLKIHQAMSFYYAKDLLLYIRLTCSIYQIIYCLITSLFILYIVIYSIQNYWIFNIYNGFKPSDKLYFILRKKELFDRQKKSLDALNYQELIKTQEDLLAIQDDLSSCNTVMFRVMEQEILFKKTQS